MDQSSSDIIFSGIPGMKPKEEQPKKEKKKLEIKRKSIKKTPQKKVEKKVTELVVKELELAKHTSYSNVIAAIGFGMAEYNADSNLPTGKCTIKVIIEHG